MNETIETKCEVKEVFGKFLVLLDGKITEFEDKAEAEAASILQEKGAEMSERAEAYCKAKKLEGKNAVGKTRIIKDFLAFEAAASLPEVPVKSEDPVASEPEPAPKAKKLKA
jgi:hypothetical protein